VLRAQGYGTGPPERGIGARTEDETAPGSRCGTSTLGSVTVLGADTVLWVGIVVVVATLALLLVVIAPWKSVRNEPPLDDDIETRLLLGEDPAKIAADVDVADARRAPVIDLDDDRDD
jgi:hypothetical protein